MVLPLVAAGVGFLALLGVFAIVIEPLSLLVGGAAALTSLRLLEQRGISYTGRETVDLALNVGISALLGLVLFKTFGWVLTAFGLTVGILFALGVFAFGLQATVGGVVFLFREVLGL